jgi:hypothetical protein
MIKKLEVGTNETLIQEKATVLSIIRDNGFTDADIYDYLIDPQTVLLYIQKRPIAYGIFNTIKTRYNDTILLKQVMDVPNLLKDLTMICSRGGPMYDIVHSGGRTVPIYFQHKLADSVSVPVSFYNLTPFLLYHNKELRWAGHGSLFNNCQKQVDCPQAYYKKIKYTYNGKHVDLSTLTLDDFEF